MLTLPSELTGQFLEPLNFYLLYLLLNAVFRKTPKVMHITFLTSPPLSPF